MQSRSRKYARKAASALICAAAILAGCHGNPNTSGYGIAWVSLTDEPGDYTSYVVTIDSVTLTRSDGVVITAVGTPEVVDFTQVHNIAELWSSGAVPIGTYVSATITVDYTAVAISVLYNGIPTAATVLDATTELAPTTYAVTLNFDPQNQPTVTPTYASTSAQLLAIDFNLAASGWVDFTKAGPVAFVRPFFTIGHLPDDTKLIRVRGPLINSSTDVQTYTVYIRPFYDEANNIGTVTLFSQPNTVYTLNGNTYLGSNGLAQLAVLSAGTTMTAGFTTFQPDYNPLNGAYAGRFNLAYVVAGSTLEDIYTEGITGEVIARDGNTLTLQGSTLILNADDTFAYEVTNCNVLLGSGTIVTADDNSALTKLTSDSVAVGQHITARGIYNLTSTGSCGLATLGEAVELDSTGTTSENTGSVRLQSTKLWGPLVTSAAGSLVMDLQTIDNYPVSLFNFAGNGSTPAHNPVPATFSVTTPGLSLPAGTAIGDPIWVDGVSTAFGAAPPDFRAFALNNESSVQVAGGQLDGGASTAPGIGLCGIGSQVCEPASLQIVWRGTDADPFETITDTGFSLKLDDPNLLTYVVRIGPESIDVKTLPSSPLIVPTILPVTQTFAPRYAWGVPATATVTSTSTTASTTALEVASAFDVFITGILKTISTTNPALQFQATGLYNRTNNTFTATSTNFVL
ncbi:MAG: hypothetical protein ABSG29_02910 [Steroidobacteraceae bacterium]